MSNLGEYVAKRGVTAKQMEVARKRTREKIDSYNLREARMASNMTQVELAKAMGVSQNRVSRMENGSIRVMSLDTIQKYVEALGGSVLIVADLPTGQVNLV